MEPRPDALQALGVRPGVKEGDVDLEARRDLLAGQQHELSLGTPVEHVRDAVQDAPDHEAA
jgi:hypothetical protein